MAGAFDSPPRIGKRVVETGSLGDAGQDGRDPVHRSLAALHGATPTRADRMAGGGTRHGCGIGDCGHAPAAGRPVEPRQPGDYDGRIAVRPDRALRAPSRTAAARLSGDVASAVGITT